MKELFCNLKIRGWEFQEQYTDDNGGDLSAIIYGKISHTDGVLDKYDFKLNLRCGVFSEQNVCIRDESVIIDMSWPRIRLDSLIKNLESCSLKAKGGSNLMRIRLSAVLLFQESFDFNLAENKDCQVLSLTKSVSKIT